MIHLSRSTFYYKPKVSRLVKAKQDVDIQEAVERVHLEIPAAGYRPMLQYLRRQGMKVGERRLRRVMRENGLHAMFKRAFVRTTDSNHNYRVYRNLLPQMGVNDINQVWVADITYIRIQSAFVYLAVILDVYSRRVVGWALSRKIDAKLTLGALEMAINDRKPPSGCIHHSDRGVQYLCDDYVELLKKNNFHVSHSAKGNPYDNAFAESFMKTLKVNEVHLWEYETYGNVLERIPTFIEQVYNRKRVHSALEYLTPEEFEKKWAVDINEKSESASRPLLIL